MSRKVTKWIKNGFLLAAALFVFLTNRVQAHNQSRSNMIMPINHPDDLGGLGSKRCKPHCVKAKNETPMSISFSRPDNQ